MVFSFIIVFSIFIIISAVYSLPIEDEYKNNDCSSKLNLEDKCQQIGYIYLYIFIINIVIINIYL